MTEARAPRLPPNPYKRSPIKQLADLAGRSRELSTIRYYLNLTASGQSPHLALIGQRGVGKTSLLNGTGAIAKDLKLLAVRLDMNELKASSPGRFWHDLYSALALTMVNAGCWGGSKGPIYAELLRMLHQRQPGDIDKAVLQVPFVFSCHQGSIDGFDLPDALVVSDFEACLTELQGKGMTGIALLIDEADCLGKNVPLLQMFRNIFQSVERCSLIMAGTEAVFPGLSEVFSPIPRQFHRVDVKPFAHWLDTRRLVRSPLSDDCFSAVVPTDEVVQELHELCGGAPDEVQLYCHHMFRSVEDGSAATMALSPQVFREVLREYRSNTPADVGAVLNAIARLPDKLLFQARWLARRTLTCEENIRVTVLERELKHNEVLSTEDRAAVARELSDGYRTLFEAGITETEDAIHLKGAPLTAGFWKSYVEVERGKRWWWHDESYSTLLLRRITGTIGKGCAAAARWDFPSGDKSVAALVALRAGRVIAGADVDINELVISALIARDTKAEHAVDVTLQVESPAGRHTTRVRFFEERDVKMTQLKMEACLEEHEAVLSANRLSVVVREYTRWVLPTAEELHRLGNIFGAYISEEFGPSQQQRAISMFETGDFQGAADMFEKMLADKEDAAYRNNVGFCQILLGQTSAALRNLMSAMNQHYDPLIELNKGVAEALEGNLDTAEGTLRKALQGVDSQVGGQRLWAATSTLVLEPTERKVWYHADLPTDAAVVANLWRIGVMPRGEMESELTQRYPVKAPAWLATISDP